MPKIALDDFFLHAEFVRRLLGEHRTVPRRVQVERVHVEAALAAQVRARYPHVHSQQLVTRVLPEAADSVRRSPCVMKISSPLISVGTSMVGRTADGSGADGEASATSAAKGRAFSSLTVVSMGSEIFSLAAGSVFSSTGWRRLDHRCCGTLSFAEPRRLVEQHAQGSSLRASL